MWTKWTSNSIRGFWDQLIISWIKPTNSRITMIQVSLMLLQLNQAHLKFHKWVMKQFHGREKASKSIVHTIEHNRPVVTPSAGTRSPATSASKRASKTKKTSPNQTSRGPPTPSSTPPSSKTKASTSSKKSPSKPTNPPISMSSLCRRSSRRPSNSCWLRIWEGRVSSRSKKRRECPRNSSWSGRSRLRKRPLLLRRRSTPTTRISSTTKQKSPASKRPNRWACPHRPNVSPPANPSPNANRNASDPSKRNLSFKKAKASEEAAKPTTTRARIEKTTSTFNSSRRRAVRRITGICVNSRGTRRRRGAPFWSLRSWNNSVMTGTRPTRSWRSGRGSALRITKLIKTIYTNKHLIIQGK